MQHDQTEQRHDDDTDDDVWCEVEVQKGSLVSVYRGRISRQALMGWQEGTLRGAVAINDVYWPWDDGWSSVVRRDPTPTGRARCMSAPTAFWSW